MHYVDLSYQNYFVPDRTSFQKVTTVPTHIQYLEGLNYLFLFPKMPEDLVIKEFLFKLER